MAAPLFSGLFSGLDASGVRRAGGSAPVDPVFPAKDFYFNDFAGIANSTKLRDLPGWAAYNSTSSVAASRDLWQVKSNAIQRVSGTDSAAQPGTFIIGQNTGSDNHTVKCKLVALPGSGGLLNIVVGATAENNSLYLRCSNASGVMQSFIIARNVGGTLTTLLTQAPSTSGLGRALLVGDELELQIFDRAVHLFVNGLRITPAAGVNIDTGTAFVKGNICGFGTGQGATYDDVYVAQLAGAVSVADTPIFWPGSIAAGGREVPLSGAYSGDVPALDYQVVNSASGAVVKDWARCVAPLIAAGAWAASVFVPMCDNAINPKVRVRIRAANDTDARAPSTVTAVGFGASSYGQSNSHYRGIPGSTVYPVNGNTYTWSTSAESKWKGGTPTTLERSQLWALQLSEATGVPVGICIAGVSSRTISSLVTTEWAGTKAIFDAAGMTGFSYSTLWTQGEAESAQAVAFNVAAYRANFDTLLGLLGEVSITPEPSVGICVIGKNSGTHVSGPTFGNANWSAARQCLFELTDKPNVHVATGLFDAIMADTLHYVSDAYVENGRRAGLSMRKALGYGGYDGRGPIITGAVRSGAVVTLGVDLNGAASIAGTGLTNYDVSVDNFVTTLPISSVAVSVGSVVITLVADPLLPVKVRSFYGMSFGTPTLAIGTYADGTTIPVEPLYIPVIAS